MSPKNADETISKIDSIIRILSKSAPRDNLVDQNEIKALNAIEEDDKPRLVEQLEDMIVLLKEEPDNKRKILEIHDTIEDEFGHVPPVFDVLNSVKGFFLNTK